MTLFTICSNVLSVVGWPALTSVAANGDGTARQLFNICNDELRSLCEDKNWPQLEIEYDFTTVPGQGVYPLPSDCKSLLANSAFNKDQYYALKGSVGSQEWNYRHYGILGNLDRWAFRVVYVNGVQSIEFTTVPTTAQNLVISYVSNAYAIGDDNTLKAVFEADTDSARCPERLIELGVKWRFRRAKGLDFSVELAEYNTTVNTQYSKVLAQADIPIGGRRYMQDTPLTRGFVPDTGFGA